MRAGNSGSPSGGVTGTLMLPWGTPPGTLEYMSGFLSCLGTCCHCLPGAHFLLVSRTGHSLLEPRVQLRSKPRCPEKFMGPTGPTGEGSFPCLAHPSHQLPSSQLPLEFHPKPTVTSHHLHCGARTVFPSRILPLAPLSPLSAFQAREPTFIHSSVFGFIHTGSRRLTTVAPCGIPIKLSPTTIQTSKCQFASPLPSIHTICDSLCTGVGLW